tara:strand:- start:394 stop:663 length:270 start_codon:yes stop_codon:yes gene_type:complete
MGLRQLLNDPQPIFDWFIDLDTWVTSFFVAPKIPKIRLAMEDDPELLRCYRGYHQFRIIEFCPVPRCPSKNPYHSLWVAEYKKNEKEGK